MAVSRSAAAPVGSLRSKREIPMNKLNRGSRFQRLTIAASAVFAIMVMAEPVRADHVERGLGAIVGGVVGGAIGSTIGKGRGRSAAIGVGSALGALYGSELAGHHHHRYPPRHAHYAHPRRSHAHAPAVVTYVPQPVPVYVHPTPVYVAPPTRVAETSITIPASGRVSVAAQQSANITECRLLEGGLAPVYGCRDTHGHWRILR